MPGGRAQVPGTCAAAFGPLNTHGPAAPPRHTLLLPRHTFLIPRHTICLLRHALMSGGRAQVPGACAAAFGSHNAHGRASSHVLQVCPRRGVCPPPRPELARVSVSVCVHSGLCLRPLLAFTEGPPRVSWRTLSVAAHLSLHQSRSLSTRWSMGVSFP